jgi:hypothetical protein
VSFLAGSQRQGSRYPAAVSATFRRAVRRARIGLAAAVADVWRAQTLSIASPLVGFSCAYLAAYAVGAVLQADQVDDPVVMFGAVAIGFVSFLVGVALAWPLNLPTARPARANTGGGGVFWLGVTLVGVGVVAIVAYLVAIGQIPLFMADVEQARVDAALAGGAPLRVLSMLSLVGVWLLAAQAGASGRASALVGAAALAAAVGFLQLLTANRSPAFSAVHMTAVAATFAAGWYRLPFRGVAVLLGILVAIVLLAGVVGAYRYGRTPETWRDPVIAEAVASGNLTSLTGKALRDYLVVPVQNLQLTLKAIPALTPWRVGYTYVQPILTVMPGRQTTFDQDLKAALQQDYAGGGTVPSLLGEAYANFGPFGWVLVPFGIGAGLALLYGHAMKVHTALGWTLYGYALLHAMGGTIGGLFVASVFPYVVYLILGLATFAQRRR